MKVKEAAVGYPADKVFTYHDYIILPEDGKRYEIIEGELTMVAGPYSIHQITSQNLEYSLENFIKGKNIGRYFHAPIDVVLSKINVVKPDILFIARENQHMITEKNIAGAPDLVIEIISPSSAYYDLIEKKEIYEKYGVREYWLVDPKKQWVEVYQNVNQQFERVQRADRDGQVASLVLRGFNLSLTAIFSE